MAWMNQNHMKFVTVTQIWQLWCKVYIPYNKDNTKFTSPITKTIQNLHPLYQSQCQIYIPYNKANTIFQTSIPKPIWSQLNNWTFIYLFFSLFIYFIIFVYLASVFTNFLYNSVSQFKSYFTISNTCTICLVNLLSFWYRYLLALTWE